MEVCSCQREPYGGFVNLLYLDEGANVLVFDCALAGKLVKAATVGAVTHRLVLKITFAALVANGTVKRVIGQQKSWED